MSERRRLAGDVLAAEYPDRCRVCLLPLPRGGDENGICSRRCAGRRGESETIAEQGAPLKGRILQELAGLRKGTTMCPGELSRRVLPGMELPLTLLRPLIFELSAAGKVRLSQKGVFLPWWKIRGPFRVGVK